MIKVEIEEEKVIESLEEIVKRHPKSYVREKASAILKVYNGINATKVALKCLLQRRKPETVRGWIHKFNDQGIESFIVNKGRGRPPAFSPSTRIKSSDPNAVANFA